MSCQDSQEYGKRRDGMVEIDLRFVGCYAVKTGFRPRLPAVQESLGPDLAPDGMDGQVLNVVYQAVIRERFQHFHNARMQRRRRS